MSDNRPAHKIRGSAGSGVALALWKHDSDKGPWYTATPAKSYNDEAGQWHDTTSFKQQDFLELSEMFREAHAWVKEQTRAHAAQHSQEADPQEPAPAGHPGLAAREAERKHAGGRQR
ncbi:MAG TPA: hypothetical protein VKU02_21495 [Gemmataceae bacterium]|nr:hypothetical protein [Gemmataceae bacterium]